MKKILVSNTLKKTLPFLTILAKLSNKNRKLILKEVGGDKMIYNSFREIVHNYKKGFFKSNKTKNKKLHRYEKVFKQFSNSKNSKCFKKRCIINNQIGGFWGILGTVIASILSSAISRNV